MQMLPLKHPPTPTKENRKKADNTTEPVTRCFFSLFFLCCFPPLLGVLLAEGLLRGFPAELEHLPAVRAHRELVLLDREPPQILGPARDAVPRAADDPLALVGRHDDGLRLGAEVPPDDRVPVCLVRGWDGRAEKKMVVKLVSIGG